MLEKEDWSLIRRLYLKDNKSMRWIAEEFGFSRKTVSKYLRDTEAPKYRLGKPRRNPVMDKYVSIVLGILEQDKLSSKKQRHTVKRIFDRLKHEYGYSGCYSTVKRFIALKTDKSKPVYIPLEFQPGADAQIDFGDVYVCVDCLRAGEDGVIFNSSCTREQTKLQCFVMRLNYSRAVFVKCFPRANLEAFLAAHVDGFAYFGGVPSRISYDNLTLAVKKVLVGKARELNSNFQHLAGHYGFETNFCTPGKQGAHEKGGVEGEIGYVRRNWLVPPPHVASIDALNSYLLLKCREDLDRMVAGQECTIGKSWEQEQPHLLDLPKRSLEPSMITTGKVDGYGLVRFDNNFYSVPSAFGGKTLWVKAFWDFVEISDGEKVVAKHHRRQGKKDYAFDPMHYLDLLEKRPQAVRYARPLLRHVWPQGYWEYYQAMASAKGTSHAGKDFVKVLRMHSKYGTEITQRAIQEALSIGASNADVIQNIIYRETRQRREHGQLDLNTKGHLASILVELPDLSKYQQLVLQAGEYVRESVA